MYRILSIDGDRWRIVDAANRLVFVGSQRQGEDWLDRQENLQPRPWFFSELLQGIAEPWVRSLGRLMRTAPVRG